MRYTQLFFSLFVREEAACHARRTRPIADDRRWENNLFWLSPGIGTCRAHMGRAQP